MKSLILIFSRNIKQALRSLLSEQRQYYNTFLFFFSLLPLLEWQTWEKMMVSEDVNL